MEDSKSSIFYATFLKIYDKIVTKQKNNRHLSKGGKSYAGYGTNI